MSKKLYVGNLPFSATESDLRSLFQSHGPVASVNVIMDRETGRARGFAFVEMEQANDAANAMRALDGSDMDGRTLRVNEAQDKRGGGGGGGGRSRPLLTRQRQAGEAGAVLRLVLSLPSAHGKTSMRQQRCANDNHGRSVVTIRFCPTCGVVVNENVLARGCTEVSHARMRRRETTTAWIVVIGSRRGMRALIGAHRLGRPSSRRCSLLSAW